MNRLIPCSFAAAACLIASVAPADQITYTDLYTLTTTGNVLSPMWMHGTNVVGYTHRYVPLPIDAAVTDGALWTPDHPEGISLIPAGYTTAVVYGLNNTQQVGTAFNSITSGNCHAMIWTGSAASAIDLHPTGYNSSLAQATDGTQQGGLVVQSVDANKEHAALWQGTAASFVDLNPAGFDKSQVTHVGGGHQVGYGYIVGAQDHALLWSGTAESAIDLSPNGYRSSRAIGLLGDVQLGYATPDITGAHDHAVLWHGSAESVIDLNGDLYSSAAMDISEEGIVVGGGYTTTATSVRRAMAWDVNSGTQIDLQSVLPSNIKQSMALDIEGNIVYGLAQDTQNNWHAIQWTLPVPEPAGMGVMAIGGMMLARRKRNRQ